MNYWFDEECDLPLCRELAATCPCGGYVTNDVKMYLTSDESLVVIGQCCKCQEVLTAEFNLLDLWLSTPSKGGDQ